MNTQYTLHSTQYTLIKHSTQLKSTHETVQTTRYIVHTYNKQYTVKKYRVHSTHYTISVTELKGTHYTVNSTQYTLKEKMHQSHVNSTQNAVNTKIKCTSITNTSYKVHITGYRVHSIVKRTSLQYTVHGTHLHYTGTQYTLHKK